MNSNGTGKTALTTPTLYYSSDEDPAWSPDGTKIAYTHSGGTTNIWVMSADGSAKAPLTACQVDSNAHPKWQSLPGPAAQSVGVPAAIPLPCSPPTPTPSPTPRLRQGDVNCSGKVDETDATLLIRYDAGLHVTPVPGCPDIGSIVFGSLHWGDVNCSGSADGVDPLEVLVYVASLQPVQPPTCRAIGLEFD